MISHLHTRESLFCIGMNDSRQDTLNADDTVRAYDQVNETIITKTSQIDKVAVTSVPSHTDLTERQESESDECLLMFCGSQNGCPLQQ